MERITFLAAEEEKYAYGEAAHEARMTLSEWMRQVLNSSTGGEIVMVRAEKKSSLPTMDDLIKSGAVKSGKDFAQVPSSKPLTFQETFQQATTQYKKKPEIGPDGYPIMNTEDI